MTPSTSKKIRARPLGQQVVQNESDLKPEFRLKVRTIETKVQVLLLMLVRCLHVCRSATAAHIMKGMVNFLILRHNWRYRCRMILLLMALTRFFVGNFTRIHFKMPFRDIVTFLDP